MRNGTALAALAAALISTLANAAPAPDGKNRKILLENVSSETIRELYAAPTTAKTWEEEYYWPKEHSSLARASAPISITAQPSATTI